MATTATTTPLRAAREKRKLTLLQVFQKTGIKPSTLSRLESRPSTRPGVDTAHRLAMFYGLSTQKLFPVHDVGGAK